MEKCSFCGKVKEKTKFLVAGKEGFICDECISTAHELVNISPEEHKINEKARTLANEMYVHENEVNRDSPITKTARVVAHNREITLNVFENLFDIKTNRYLCSGSKEYHNSNDNNYELSEETFCLLVKLLNESVKEFGIDYEAVIKRLTKGKELKISYIDLTEEN